MVTLKSVRLCSYRSDTDLFERQVVLSPSMVAVQRDMSRQIWTGLKIHLKIGLYREKSIFRRKCKFNQYGESDQLIIPLNFAKNG